MTRSFSAMKLRGLGRVWGFLKEPVALGDGLVLLVEIFAGTGLEAGMDGECGCATAWG
jgi:hypothetical protein